MLDNEREEGLHDARRQAFTRLASTVPVPPRAQAAWLASSNFPVAAFLIFHVSIVVHTALGIAAYFVGSLSYPSALVRYLARATGGLFVMCGGFSYAQVIAYGPDAHLHRPHALFIAHSCKVLPVAALTIFNIFSSVAFVPYHNRFIFLITFSTEMFCGIVAGLLCYLPIERSPPSTHPSVTAARAAIRALRISDGVSDALVVRVMYERIAMHDCPWYGRVDCQRWRAMMLTVAACAVVDLIIGVATMAASKAMESSHELRMRRAAVAMYAVSLVCELVIICSKIVTLVSRGGGTAPNYFFLSASLLTTLAVAYINAKGSAVVISALLTSARRVRADVVRRASRSSQGQLRSAAASACSVRCNEPGNAARASAGGAVSCDLRCGLDNPTGWTSAQRLAADAAPDVSKPIYDHH